MEWSEYGMILIIGLCAFPVFHYPRSILMQSKESWHEGFEVLLWLACRILMGFFECRQQRLRRICLFIYKHTYTHTTQCCLCENLRSSLSLVCRFYTGAVCKYMNHV